MGFLEIGEAARHCGVKVPTIRYYEQIGLLPAPPRSEGNRRQYDAGDLRRLVFIRHARDLGFAMEAIRTMLNLQDQPEQSCATVDQIARARLDEIEERITSLNTLKAELQRLVASCTQGRVSECRVIEALGHDPGQVLARPVGGEAASDDGPRR